MFAVGPEMWTQLSALAQVLLIDLTLAADNAMVVGLAVAGLPAHQKRPAILVGITLATVQLLEIVGLMLAGGLLLLWVAWKMFRELRHGGAGQAAVAAPKSLRAAMFQIVLADLSMSLDNVLAVAGAAHGHTWVLVVGLAVSVVLMGVAANLVAGLLMKYRWLTWIGLLIVVFVALKMIWEGGHEVAVHI